MKKNFFYTLAVCLVAAAMTSCTTYSYTSRSAAIRGTSIGSKALGAEVIADFSRKVTATSEPCSTLKDAINGAQFKCLQQENVDVVVDPIYKIEFKGIKKNPFVVTVLGFAGKYKQVPVTTEFEDFVAKKYTKEDIEKYKLLNDPNFLKYYYQKEEKMAPKGEVTNYFINTDASCKSKARVESPKTVAPKAEAAPKASSSSVMLKNDNKRDKAAQAKPIKPFKQSKQIRDAGACLMGIGGGGLMFIMGGALAAAANNDWEKANSYKNYNKSQYNQYYNKYMSETDAHIAMESIGVICVAAGIPMVAVGQVRMNKAKKANLAFGGTSDGLGMRLTF